jgi:peptide deformylase
MIRPILIWPDSTLLTVSAPVPSEMDWSMVNELVRDMFDTLYESGGVGLAAIQIGVPLRVFIMDCYGKDYVFVNPVIKGWGGTHELTNEGCLSLPGIIEQVKRWEEVTVESLDRNGEPQTLTFHHLEAQCIQHEIEHLDGVMIPDNVSSVRRDRIRQKMKKASRSR